MSLSNTILPHQRHTPSEVHAEQKRLDFPREHNRIQSPMFVLPTEILTMIFENVCKPVDLRTRYGLSSSSNADESWSKETRAQFVLGGVCRYWRLVMKSMPHLWAFIDVSFGPEATYIFSHFLSHSAPLPVSLGITIQDTTLESSLTKSPFLASLTAHVTRIGKLYISFLTQSWLKCISEMPNLAKLQIGDGDTEEETLTVNSALTYLSLRLVTCKLQLRWSVLTIIHLNSIAAVVALDLLVKCQNATEFRLCFAEDPGMDNFKLPQQPFNLPSLTTFEWSSCCSDCEVDESMLRFNRMPALKHLRWAESGDLLDESHSRRDFFRRLPLNLVALDVNGEGWSGPCAEEFFDLLPDDLGIEHLRLEKCSRSFLEAAFQKLTPGDGTQLKFPKLKLIEVVEPDISDDCRKLSFSMLQARCLQNGTASASNVDHIGQKILMKVVGPDGLKWDKEKIKELSLLGADVEFFPDYN